MEATYILLLLAIGYIINTILNIVGIIKINKIEKKKWDTLDYLVVWFGFFSTWLIFGALSELKQENKNKYVTRKK